MKKFFLLLFLFVIASSMMAINKVTDQQKTDAHKVINNSKEVYAFRVDPKTEEQAVNNVCGFNLMSDKVKLLSREQATIKAVLNDTLPGRKNRAKYSTFMPHTGVMFKTKNDSVVILFDDHSAQWRTYFHGKNWSVNDDYVCLRIHDLMEDILKRSTTGQTSSDVLNEFAAVPDSLFSLQKSKTKFPSEFSAIINNAVSLTWYVLDPIEHGKSKEQLQGSDVLQKKEDKSSLKQLSDTVVKDLEQLEFSTIIKDLQFAPDLALVIISKNKQKATISFSLLKGVCRLQVDDYIGQANCSKIQNDIVKTAQTLFPDNNYFKLFSEKE